MTITLTSNQGATQTICPKVLNGPFAVHRPAFEGNQGIPWVLTHVPSGAALAYPRTLTEAKRLIAQLIPLGDWTWAHPSQCPGDLKEAARTICRPSRSHRPGRQKV